jgi:hypothetical protein
LDMFSRETPLEGLSFYSLEPCAVHSGCHTIDGQQWLIGWKNVMNETNARKLPGTLCFNYSQINWIAIW